jgi:threonine dehydrogenase-like Zn-dependent dehydrogenase
MGLVGQLALQYVALTGCETLTAVDLSELRLQTARAHGATHLVNPKTGDLKEAANEITGGRGFDCIIEASGYPELIPPLIDTARNGGRIVVLGSIWHRTVEIDFMPFHLKEMTLLSAHQPLCPTTETVYFPWTQQYNRRQALQMIADRRLQVQPLITHSLPFEAAAEAYRLLRDQSDRALGIVLTFDTAAT